MANDDTTVYGGDMTLPDGTETKPDEGLAVLDDKKTLLNSKDGDLSFVVDEVVLIEKGSLLFEIYRIETDAVAGGMGRV